MSTFRDVSTLLYLGLWVAIILFSFRLARAERRAAYHQQTVEVRLSFIAVVVTQALVEGRPPEEIEAMLKALQERIEADRD